MASLNKCMIIGNLGHDPEMKYLPNGNAVCNFSIATKEEWKDQAGTPHNKTEWHKIVVFGKLAEICGQWLKKGNQTYIEGKIQTRNWDDRDGNKKYTTEIVANVMTMLGGNIEGSKSANDSESQDDDLPF